MGVVTKRPSGWLALLFAILTASAASAASPAGLTSADCLTCHNAEPGAAEKAKAVPLWVNQKLFQSSVHSPLGCTGCHSDVTAFPHNPAPQRVKCEACHPAEASAFAQSVHAAAARDDKLKYPACLGCHGNPHGIVHTTDATSPVYPLNLPRTCGYCHGSPELARRYGLANVYALYVDSIHGFALTHDGLLVAATCESCHGSHKILGHNDPNSGTYRANVPTTCGKCHAGVRSAYLEGVHGKAAMAGKTTAPVCVDCHTVHQITRVAATGWQAKTVATCGKCHKERLHSYRDTFHGQVTELGFVETARCWSCHGEHRILPASDSRSQVAPAHLRATCGQCHGEVSASFVTYQPHPNPHDRALNPSLYYAAVFMNLLLLSVFAFFGLHTLLWLVRSWSEKNHNSAASESGRPQ